MKEIKDKLVDFALKVTTPFCYQCYVKAPSGACPKCSSDDLMRHLEGVGVEYGTDWVVEYILEKNFNTVDLDEFFEEHIRDCYPETVNVGWLTLDTVDVLKTYDQTSWEIAQSEYKDALESNEEIITFDNGFTYYWLRDIEELLGAQFQLISL